MNSSLQINHRESLDGIIAQTILIYRWAVIVSFAFIGAGFVIAVLSDEQVTTKMGTPAEIIDNVLNLHASGFFGVGITLMILTPIVMITAAAISFFRANDRRFGLITLSVAIILSLSIVISFVIG